MNFQKTVGKYAEKILKKIGFFRYFPLEGQNFEKKNPPKNRPFLGTFPQAPGRTWGDLQAPRRTWGDLQAPGRT